MYQLLDFRDENYLYFSTLTEYVSRNIYSKYVTPKSHCIPLLLVNFMHCMLKYVEYNKPMSLALAATGLRNSATNFLASSRISIMLLSKAKSGARGKDATNNVTKPNWMTRHRRRQKNILESHHHYP